MARSSPAGHGDVLDPIAVPRNAGPCGEEDRDVLVDGLPRASPAPPGCFAALPGVCQGTLAIVFRAEIAGSLLRLSYLKDARVRLDHGDLAAAAFKGIEDRAVDQANSLQEEAGPDVVSDGEMRRSAVVRGRGLAQNCIRDGR